MQVPSSYGFGMVEKSHVRGISIDKRQYFAIAWGKLQHKGGEKGQKKKFLSASYIPLTKLKN